MLDYIKNRNRSRLLKNMWEFNSNEIKAFELKKLAGGEEKGLYNVLCIQQYVYKWFRKVKFASSFLYVISL